MNPLVAFLPGFAQRGDAWASVAERVGQKYRSVAIDFSTWTFDGRLREIAERVDDGDVAVGYSMGGRLGLAAALRRPPKFGALVLVGTSAGIEGADARDERRRQDDELADWVERHTIEEFAERWESQPVFATQSPELVTAQRPGRLSHEPARLAQLRRSAGQGMFDPVWDELERIDCPVLAIAGELDDKYADASFRIAERVKHGRARLVPGAGHAPQLEKPDEFAALLLEFLDEHFGEG
ncbi:MAG TPA: alpha/beta fold hydrolase [Thermoleophilaceae bacterium]|nr:alpha/beta fold hydrolase [Thermoleophilaceae bacterium]